MIKNNNLNYRLEIQGKDNRIYIWDSRQTNDKISALKVDYTIKKTYTNEANIGTIIIYNLSESTRQAIKKTKLEADIRYLNFAIGYDNQLYSIFTGSIKECSSERNGNNIITTIQGWDGGEAITRAETNITIDNTTDIYGTLFNDLKKYNITKGYISPKAQYKVAGTRGIVLNGKTWQLIKKYQNELDIFINNQQLYIYAKGEYRSVAYKINAETGLLNTPRDFGTGYIEVETIAEPTIDLKTIVDLESTTDPFYNGTYQVISVEQNGSICKIGDSQNWKSTFKLQKI